MRGRPGYEHLNDPLHIIIEAELPANIVDMRLRQAKQIIEELLKPMVFFLIHPFGFSIQILLPFHYDVSLFTSTYHMNNETDFTFPQRTIFTGSK